MKGAAILLVLDAALAGLALMLADQERQIPAWSIFGALGLLGTWQVIVYLMQWPSGRAFRVEPFFQSTHCVQGFLQAAIFVYLALYWGEIWTYTPLIIAQAIVGYLCDMLLSWSRGRTARMGLGIAPIILSTNLFLWFKEEYFYLQLLMVALAFFAKEFLARDSGGRRRHIFNPSAFPLAVVSAVLLATETFDMTRGADIVAAFEVAPNFYEVIFLLGLVTQALYRTTPVSLGTVLSLYLLFQASQLAFGGPVSESPIHVHVFLGLTFLVTDPATSPKTPLGRFLFGAAYGLGVFVTYLLLRTLRQPAYFDKLLIVPLLNFIVPQFNRISDAIEKRLPQALARVSTGLVRFSWVAAYCVLFVLIDPSLKDRSTKVTVLPQPAMQASADLFRLWANQQYCRTVYPDAFKAFGIGYEFAHLAAIRQIYREGPFNGRAPSGQPPG